MFDWLYAIPLTILILGAGVTYFIPSSLLGPLCMIISIAVFVFIWKALKKEESTKGLTMDDLNDITQDTGDLEKPNNAGHCSGCNSDWLLSDCLKEIDQETWELPPYTIYTCPKCKTELDYFFYEEIAEYE